MPRSEDERRSLLEATADNHRVWFRRTASGSSPASAVRLPGGELIVGREAMIFPETGRALDVDALLAEIRGRGCASVGCWSLVADARLATRLTALGFGWGWRPHWMALDLDPDDPQSAGFVPGSEREPASNAFAVTLADEPSARTLPYAPAGPVPPECIRLGVRLREKVIGHVTVNPAGDVAGIYDMGVVPRVRRRGIGLALIRAACRLAAERGCRHAVLNATADGAGLYRRAGFTTLGWGQTWWWTPRPRPTPRERALAEAIGAGDAMALTALGPTAAELDARLRCGERPLVLALLLDRAAIAEDMLGRAPELIHLGVPPTRTSPDHVTLLHLAVEHDRPAFVELALAHGVDRDARDDHFGATALGWAEHLRREDLARRLRRAGAAV